MSGSGAIPKGGARPKTKYVGNQHNSNLEADQSGPLEKRGVMITKHGVQQVHPALDPIWVEKRTFMGFSAPPEITFEDGTPIMGASEAWLEQMEFLMADLKWMLELSYHKFWSQVVYSKDIHTCLDSFLAQRPRWFEKVELNPPMESMLTCIDELIFRIFVRMATHKESKVDFITPSVFGGLIYTHFLFDSCKLLDLCVLYGATNRALLERMINNIFTNQPRYNDDVTMLVTSLLAALDNVEVQLGIGNKLRLGNGSNIIPMETLNDIIMYLLDIFSSLHAFFMVYPKAVNAFHEKEYELKLSAFYEKIMPSISEYLASIAIDADDFPWAAELEHKLSLVRTSALAVFNDFLDCLCLQPLHSGRVSPQVLDESMSIFVQIISSCTAEPVFITDLYSVYCLQDQIDAFQIAGADLTNLNFIKEGVEVTKNESRALWKTTLKSATGPVARDEVSEDPTGMNGYCDGETGAMPEMDVTCMISSIQDLLPELGAGFIRKCLEYYNYSTEDVLNAILENNLAPSLVGLDRAMPEEEPPVPEPPTETAAVVQEQEEEFPSLIDQRLNIYDHDEFDVFHNKNIAFSQIHKGKKEKQVAIDDDLKFKLKQIARAYDDNQGYSIYDDELKYSSVLADNYDDEYDDTYDDDDNKDIDSFGNDRKGLSVPNIRGRGALNKPLVESESEDDAEEEENNESKQILDKSGAFRRPGYVDNHPRQRGSKKEKVFIPFCQNPEVLREKAAQRRLSKRGGNTGWSGRRQQEPENIPEQNSDGVENQNDQPPTNSGPKSQRGPQSQKDPNTKAATARAHRHKNNHKNEHKRLGAQRKYGNFT